MNKPVDEALALALRYLRAAERTEAELRAHLTGKGVSEAEVNRVVAAMLARRFVSDERVAEREVELAKGARKVGKEKAKARLLHRGTPEEVVEKAVAGYEQSEEADNALSLLRTKFKPTDDPARAARFLLARGFGEETVRAALEQTFPGIEF